MRDVLLTPTSERKSAMIDCKPLIVVVHEDPEVLDALESVLTGSDYLAATFTSAQRSIGFISRTKPDLVLAQQPGIRSHGIEFLESIKQISPSTEGISPGSGSRMPSAAASPGRRTASNRRTSYGHLGPPRAA